MRKILTGVVVSDKMQQTAVVEVGVWKKDPIIGKRYRRTTRFHAHNPQNTFHVGDRVEIGETRPLSKLKNWEILRKTQGE